MKGFEARRKKTQSRRLKKKPQCQCYCRRDVKIRPIWALHDYQLLEAMVPMSRPGLKKRFEKKIPTMREYLKQLYISDGFDIDVYPCYSWGLTPIMPYKFCVAPESPEYFEDLAKIAIETYNERRITLFGDVKVEKVNFSNDHFYLTFTAIDPSSKISTMKTFQAKIIRETSEVKTMTVEFCRLKRPPRKFPPKRLWLDGVEYDHVFDVDIGEYEPILKLPYNRSDNPYDVADKWLRNEDLPLSYRQQIVEYIMQNRQRHFAPHPLFLDLYTSSDACVSGEPSEASADACVSGGPSESSADACVSGESSESSDLFRRSQHIPPKKEMLVFDVAQFDVILTKVLEFNAALSSHQERQRLYVSKADMSRMTAMIEVLKNTSHSHSGKFADTDVALMLKVLKSWPAVMLFPVIDIMRMIVLHPDGAFKLLQFVEDENDIVIELLRKVTASPSLTENVLASVRAVTNLFKTLLFNEWLQLHRAEILDAFSICCSFSDEDIQISYATLLLNYAYLLIEKEDEEGQFQVLSAAVQMAEWEAVYTDSRFLALVTIGLLTLEGLGIVAWSFDLSNIAKAAKTSKDYKIAEVGADIEWAALETLLRFGRRLRLLKLELT